MHRHFFYGQPIRDIVKKSLSFLRAIELDRALLIVNEHVAEATVEASRHTAPQIEVLDAAGLRAWVARIDVEADINKLEIEQIMKAVSNRFAALIADDPRNLDKLEWRQIEYLVAEIFDGLGFKVTLTPSSQDGGKDVILECTVDGKDRSYIVEIKHWRSGKGVGNDAVRYFLDVLVREKRDGGLFLSTYGYANNAFESLTEIERKKVHFGTEEKLVALCRTYKKIKSGILSPPTDIAETIVANTLPLR